VVLVQVGLEREALPAPPALETLEGRVRLHVGPQVGAVGEGFATVGAAEGLLAGVRPHVTLEQPRPAEGFAADVAFVLQVVRQEVHGHGRHGDVDLAAGRAFLGQLAVQAAVGLLVPAQVGRRGVGLAALAAGVARGAARGSPR